MRKMVVVAYCQYGRWSLTTPFANLKSAQEHVQRNLSDNTIRRKDTGEVMSANTNSHVKLVHWLELDFPDNEDELAELVKSGKRMS